MSLLDSAKSVLGLGKAQSDPFSTKPVMDPQDPSTQDGVYSIKIVVGSGNPNTASDIVIARLPENFSLRVESQWEDVTSQSDSTLFKGINLAASELTNTHFKSQIMSAQMWSGNSPLEFSIPLQFKAFKDADREVIRPLKTLMKAALPSLQGGAFLNPPGPRLLQGFEFVRKVNDNPGRPVSLMIGKVLHFKDLIILNVDCDIKSIMSVTNKPMSIDCTVTFRTIVSYTTENIDQIFI
jgi:hypothetical protein